MKSGWQSPKVEKPPQGKKILWFRNGDCYVAQRFGEKYLVFNTKSAVILEEPLLYRIIDMPPGYEGRMLLSIDGKMLDVDTIEVEFPEVYKDFVSAIVEMDLPE